MNDHDVEQQLRMLELVEPSPRLDREVHALLAGAQAAGRLPRRSLPLWMSLAASLVCGVLGYLAGATAAWQTREQSAVVYVVDGSDAFERLLHRPQQQEPRSFFERRHGGIRVPAALRAKGDDHDHAENDGESNTENGAVGGGPGSSGPAGSGRNPGVPG